MTPQNTNTTPTIQNGIHTGDSTHHHDHAITPHNLRVKNINNKAPDTPICMLFPDS